MIVIVIALALLVAALGVWVDRVRAQLRRADSGIDFQNVRLIAAETRLREEQARRTRAVEALLGEQRHSRYLGEVLGDANRRALAAERSTEFLLGKLVEANYGLTPFDIEMRQMQNAPAPKHEHPGGFCPGGVVPRPHRG